MSTWIGNLQRLSPASRVQGDGVSGADEQLPLSLEEISRSWAQSQSLFPTSWLLVSLGGAMAIVALAVWLKKRRQRIASPTAADLWRSFAERSGLGLSDRRLLERVSRQQRLPSPLTMLVCPTTFDHHAEQYAEQRGDARREDLRRRLRVLRHRLFDTSS